LLALVAGCLLLVALICYRFGGEPGGFAKTCAAIAIIAIIAFTLTILVLLAQAYLAALRPIWLKLPDTRRTGKTNLVRPKSVVRKANAGRRKGG
jgi:hypothetical protein